MPEERTKTKAQAEKGRKRKRNKEGEKQKNKENEMDEFVSHRAYEVMDKKMLKKDFIGKRGFKKFISPFKEVFE